MVLKPGMLDEIIMDEFTKLNKEYVEAMTKCVTLRERDEKNKLALISAQHQLSLAKAALNDYERGVKAN